MVGKSYFTQSIRRLYDEHKDVIWSSIPMCQDGRGLFTPDDVLRSYRI
jgi:hypothetical protein